VVYDPFIVENFLADAVSSCCLFLQVMDMQLGVRWCNEVSLGLW